MTIINLRIFLDWCSNLARIERSAQKQAKSGIEDAGWYEKWWGNSFDGKGIIIEQYSVHILMNTFFWIALGGRSMMQKVGLKRGHTSMADWTNSHGGKNGESTMMEEDQSWNGLTFNILSKLTKLSSGNIRYMLYDVWSVWGWLCLTEPLMHYQSGPTSLTILSHY